MSCTQNFNKRSLLKFFDYYYYTRVRAYAHAWAEGPCMCICAYACTRGRMRVSAYTPWAWAWARRHGRMYACAVRRMHLWAYALWAWAGRMGVCVLYGPGLGVWAHTSLGLGYGPGLGVWAHIDNYGAMGVCALGPGLGVWALRNVQMLNLLGCWRRLLTSTNGCWLKFFFFRN